MAAPRRGSFERPAGEVALSATHTAPWLLQGRSFDTNTVSFCLFVTGPGWYEYQFLGDSWRFHAIVHSTLLSPPKPIMHIILDSVTSRWPRERAASTLLQNACIRSATSTGTRAWVL